MKIVPNYALVELDREDQKLIDKALNRVSTSYETLAGLHRLFINADFVDGEWTYTPVKSPTMAKARVLEIVRNETKRLAGALADLAELGDRAKEAQK